MAGAECGLQQYLNRRRRLGAEFKNVKRSYEYTGKGSFANPSELTGPGKERLVLRLPAVGTLTLY